MRTRHRPLSDELAAVRSWGNVRPVPPDTAGPVLREFTATARGSIAGLPVRPAVPALREHDVKRLSAAAVYVFGLLAAGKSVSDLVLITGLPRRAIAQALRWLRDHHGRSVADLRQWHRAAGACGGRMDLQALRSWIRNEPAPAQTRADVEASLARVRRGIERRPGNLFAAEAEKFLLAKLRGMDGDAPEGAGPGE